MSAAMLVVIVIVALVILIALFVWGLYNSLVRSRMQVRESWSGIDVQLKRRSSLIPNLVETVKGYAAHEREVVDTHGHSPWHFTGQAKLDLNPGPPAILHTQ